MDAKGLFLTLVLVVNCVFAAILNDQQQNDIQPYGQVNLPFSHLKLCFLHKLNALLDTDDNDVIMISMISS